MFDVIYQYGVLAVSGAQAAYPTIGGRAAFCALNGRGWVKMRRRDRKVNHRTRASSSFFQTRIHTDLNLRGGGNH